MTEILWNGVRVLSVRGTAIVSPDMYCNESWCEDLPWKTIEVLRIENARDGIVYLDSREGFEHRKVIILPGSFESKE